MHAWGRACRPPGCVWKVGDPEVFQGHSPSPCSCHQPIALGAGLYLSVKVRPGMGVGHRAVSQDGREGLGCRWEGRNMTYV